MKGYRRISCCCYLLFTFLDSQVLRQRTLRARLTSCLSQTLISTIYLYCSIDPTLDPPERDLLVIGRHQKNLPLPLAVYSSELSLSLLKIHGLFPIWINLASAFTHLLHFVLLNKLSLESSVQQFISFTIRHFFQTLALCFFSLRSPDFPVSLENMSTRMLCIPTPSI